jgi:hypothetical protein
MGDTGDSPSLAQFKEGFGAHLHRYDEYRLVNRTKGRGARTRRPLRSYSTDSTA